MSSGRASRACLLLVGYVALTVLFTYPLVGHLTTHHVGEAGGDAKTYLWNYWWVRTALLSSTNPFETDLIFYPLGIGLALHTLGFLQGLVYVPLSAVFGTVAAPNLIVIWTFVATALAMYALARRAGAGRAGAFLAGMVLAYCPYRLARLAGHYDLLGTEWIPLYLLLLLELAEARRPSVGLVLLTAGAAAACGYTSLSYLAFLGLFTLVFLATRARSDPRVAMRVVLVGAMVVAMMAPLLFQMRRDLAQWSYPAYPGADRYLADVASFALPTPKQTVLGESLGRAFDDNLTETAVFPGYLLLVVAMAGCMGKRQRPWAIAAGVFFVLSLGSTLHVAGTDTGIVLPFWLVGKIPLLDNLRAPSRLVVLMMTSLGVVFALTWTQWTQKWRSANAGRAATAIAAGVLVLEYLAIPVPLFSSASHPIYARIAEESSPSTVVEIPGIDQAPQELMFHQTVHGKPIFIGSTARVPTEKSEYYFGLPLVRPLIDLRKGRIELTPELIERERATAPDVARFLDLGFFVLDRAYEKRGVLRFVEETLPVERFYEDEALVVLETRREALPPDPDVLDAASPVSRQHFESGWLRAEREGDVGFRWAHRRRSTLLFRRPSPAARRITLVVAPLDDRRQQVEARLDGVWLGDVGLAPGWQEIHWTLTPAKPERSVERLELRWSTLEQAPGSDPRRLAARVREVRFDDGRTEVHEE